MQVAKIECSTWGTIQALLCGSLDGLVNTALKRRRATGEHGAGAQCSPNSCVSECHALINEPDRRRRPSMWLLESGQRGRCG